MFREPTDSPPATDDAERSILMNQNSVKCKNNFSLWVLFQKWDTYTPLIFFRFNIMIDQRNEQSAFKIDSE